MSARPQRIGEFVASSVAEERRRETIVHSRDSHGPCCCTGVFEEPTTGEPAFVRCTYCRLAAECPICHPTAIAGSEGPESPAELERIAGKQYCPPLIPTAHQTHDMTWVGCIGCGTFEPDELQLPCANVRCPRCGVLNGLVASGCIGHGEP
jgi:hypothetical protein